MGLLESHRPRIICEVSSEASGKVAELLKRFGYEIYDGELPHGRREPLDLAPWSTIAIAAP